MFCAEIMNGWSYNSTSANAVMAYTETALPLPFFLSIVSSFFHSVFLFLCLSFYLYTPVSLFHTRKKQKETRILTCMEKQLLCTGEHLIVERSGKKQNEVLKIA